MGDRVGERAGQVVDDVILADDLNGPGDFIGTGQEWAGRHSDDIVDIVVLSQGGGCGCQGSDQRDRRDGGFEYKRHSQISPIGG